MRLLLPEALGSRDRGSRLEAEVDASDFVDVAALELGRETEVGSVVAVAASEGARWERSERLSLPRRPCLRERVDVVSALSAPADLDDSGSLGSLRL